MRKILYFLSAACFAVFAASCLALGIFRAVLPVNDGTADPEPEASGCQVWAESLVPEYATCSGFAGADMVGSIMRIPILLSVTAVITSASVVFGIADFGTGPALAHAMLILSIPYLALVLAYLPWTLARWLLPRSRTETA